MKRRIFILIIILSWLLQQCSSNSSSSDGATTTPPHNNNNHNHLLIIMGRGVHLKTWMQLVDPVYNNNNDLAHVELVLGIFDGSVDTLGCGGGDNNNNDSRIKCVSVAGTTWTTGRNKLIRAALAREHEQNKTYSFWTLADADIQLHCGAPFGMVECFKQYDAFLAQLPENATAATLIENGSWPFVPNAAMVHLQAMDAAWNSFRRRTIPILFPYQPDLDANTWWSSQAIFWYRLQCLAPLYVSTPLFVFSVNAEHGDYPRNPRNYTEEHRVGTKIMGGLSGILQRAPVHFSREFSQEKIRRIPLEQSFPMDGVCDRCLNEFSGGFHSFFFGE